MLANDPMPLVLCVAVTIVPLASAQGGEAEWHAPDLAELPPVPPPPDPERPPLQERTAVRPTSDAGGRPFGLVVAGAATTAAMFLVEIVAVLIATSPCSLFGTSDCLETGLAAATVVTGAATLALVPLVVWATGASLGGSGDYGSTFLGHLLGALAWFVLPAVAAAGAEELVWPAIVFAGFAQATGAALAYELSTP